MFLSLFIYFERESESAWASMSQVGVEREAERENSKQDPTVSTEPDVGLKLTNLRDHDLNWNQELDA